MRLFLSIHPVSMGLLLTGVLAFGPSAHAGQAGPGVVQNPSFNPRPDPVVIDFGRPGLRNRAGTAAEYAPGPAFEELDAFATDPIADDMPRTPFVGRIGNGMAQIGGMVVPEAMLEGAAMVGDAEFELTAAPDAAGADIQEICAYPDQVPPGVYDYDHRPGGETPRFHTVYLNFLGGTLTADGENSAENKSGIARSGHPYPVYSGGETLAIAAAQAVQSDFQDWAVRVVYLERPPKVLPYTMVMMGGHYSDTTAGPSGGVAPLDCEDFGQRNVCYVFLNTASATSQANVASQEIGHTLGLGHTQAPDSVMAAGYAPTQSGDLGFNDDCTSIIQVAGQSAACVGVNKCHCGDPNIQHDKNTLFATFAPAGMDMVEPTIEITAPADGTEFTIDEPVVVDLDPWDDVGGYGWKLIVEDENGEVLADQVDYDRALQFELVGLPAGAYTLTALIQDHGDHVVTHSIQITVVDPNAAGETDGGDTDDGDTDASPDTGTTGAGTGTGSSGGDTDGGQPAQDEAGPAAADEGCGCRSTPAPRSTLWFAALGLLGLRRRRR